MNLMLKNVLPAYFEEGRKSHSEVWGKDLVFAPGERIKVIAPSGSGKSSLINFLYGMRSSFTGEIFYQQQSIAGLNAEAWALLRQQTVSIVFQDLRLIPSQTVLQNIEIKRQLNTYHPTSRITEMAAALGIENKLSSLAGTCSYGEQQRTAIIRALMQPFQYLLLDEPFSHLDRVNAGKAMDLILEEAAARNACVILADLDQIDFYPYTQLYHL